MRPSSGRTNPAMESSVNVLPAPLDPNRTVTPAAERNSISNEKPAESGPAAGGLRIRTSIINLRGSYRCWAGSKRIGCEAIRERQDGQGNRGNNQNQHASGCAVTAFDGIVDCDGDGLRAAGNITRDHQRDAEIAQGLGKGRPQAGPGGGPVPGAGSPATTDVIPSLPGCARRAHTIDRRFR